MSGDDEDVQNTKNALVETVGGATTLGWAGTSTAGVAMGSAAGAGLVGAAFGGGYLLGTGIDDLTGHALSHGVEHGLEYVFGDPSKPSEAQIEAEEAKDNARLAQAQLEHTMDERDSQETEAELYGSHSSVAHDDPPPPPPDGS